MAYSLKKYSDKELILFYQRRQKILPQRAEWILNLIYQRFRKKLFVYLSKNSYQKLDSQEIEDVIQETLLGLFNQFQEPDFPEKIQNLDAYLWQIAKLKMSDALRKKNTQKRRMIQYGAHEIEPWESMDLRELDNETRESIILEAFELLGRNRGSEILRLFYYEGMDTKEIAEFLNLSENVVKHIRHRAMHKLRKIISDDGIKSENF